MFALEGKPAQALKSRRIFVREAKCTKALKEIRVSMVEQVSLMGNPMYASLTVYLVFMFPFIGVW
jgi:hypothetical protein